MPFDLLSPRHRPLAAAVVVTIALAGCGGGGDAASSASPSTTANVQPADDATDRQNPFGAVIECLRAEGLDVDESAFDGPAGAGGRPDGGSLPPDVSIPEGGFPGGSIPEGGFPGGSIPEGGFPGGSIPEGGGAPEGGFPGGGQGGAGSLARALGLDADDPDVAAAIETCSGSPDG